MSRLEQRIEGYIAFKRALGFDFTGEAQRLRSYLESTDGEGLPQDSALAWACGGAGHPRSYQIQRYETVRRFSEFAHALDGGVPALQPGLLGKTGDRVVPFIYSKEDIAILMSSARSLKSPDGLRGEVTYITREEYGWLCDACNGADDNSAANHLMVTLLFSTGARISELVCLKVGDFSIAAGKGQVRIFGKGRKERTLPLWPEVAEEVERFISARRLGADDHLFGGRNVPHLTRSGARSRIDAIVKRAQVDHPSLKDKRITPHVFRHSTAMGMLESGVDISTIAIWLGHENIQTAHRYMATDMKRKEEALRKVHAAGAGKKPQARCKASEDVLDFPMSL